MCENRNHKYAEFMR